MTLLQQFSLLLLVFINGYLAPLCGADYSAFCYQQPYPVFYQTIWPCKFCSSTYGRECDLKSHMQLKHPGKLKENVGKYQCETCQQRFARAKTLETHQRNHKRQNKRPNAVENEFSFKIALTKGPIPLMRPPLQAQAQEIRDINRTMNDKYYSQNFAGLQAMEDRNIYTSPIDEPTHNYDDNEMTDDDASLAKEQEAEVLEYMPTKFSIGYILN